MSGKMIPVEVVLLAWRAGRSRGAGIDTLLSEPYTPFG